MLTLAALVAALLACGFLVFRSNILARPSNPIAQTAAAAQPIFHSLTFEPITSRDQLLSLAARAEINATSDTKALVPALQTAFSEWLIARLQSQSPEIYRSWRKQHGYIPLDAKDMSSLWNRVPEDHKARFGSALAENFDTAAEFDRLWPLAWADPTNRPAKVCTDPKGFILSVVNRPASFPSFPDVNGSLGSSVWVGQISKYMRSWWKPPRSIEQIAHQISKQTVQGNGSITLAIAGVMLEFADGTKRPLCAGFFFDPVSTTWQLDWVSLQNDANQDLAIFEY